MGDPTGNGLTADGGVVIGLDGPGHVRVWAPYDYDLTVGRNTGRLTDLRLVAGGRMPAGLRPLDGPPPKYRLGPYPERTVARDRAGAVAWKILVREPWIQTVGPIAVPGGMALVTSSGHLVVLDYRSRCEPGASRSRRPVAAGSGILACGSCRTAGRNCTDVRGTFPAGSDPPRS